MIILFELSFLFYLRSKKEKKVRKKRKNTPLFSSSSLRSAEIFIWASPNLLASQTPFGQTMLGFKIPHPNHPQVREGTVRLTKRTINVSETTTKRLLFDRREFSRSGRTLQLISEWSYSARASLVTFLSIQESNNKILIRYFQ